MPFLEHLFTVLLTALRGAILSLMLLTSTHSTVVVTPPPVLISHNATTSPAVRTATSTLPKSASKPKVVAKPPAAQPAAQTAPAPLSIPQTKTGEQVNADTRAALVNVLCITKAGGYLYPISGSGIFVSNDGVVLTNAHVGQYFLLRDYLVTDNVDCVLRTGSPAGAAYRAELLFLPPLWIAQNAKQISAPQATGTGENDYAFLLVTGTVSGSPLPASFPTIPLTLGEPSQGDNAFLAGYPAGFLDGQTIESNLFATSAFAIITQLYTFTTADHVDLVSVGGTVLSQAGASGGSVVRPQDGALEAIIATATEGTTTATRDLRAITLGHIDRSLRAQTTGGIAALLTGNLTQKADDFNATIAPTLTKELTDALSKK